MSRIFEFFRGFREAPFWLNIFVFVIWPLLLFSFLTYIDF